MIEKTGIEYLTSNGFNMDQVSMVLKNMTNQNFLSQHYVTQLPNDVLKCHTGFKRDEPYAIPRGKLEPPLGLSWTDLVPVKV